MGEGFFQFLFKSIPARSHRKFPHMTPSTFIIGIHFMIKLSSKNLLSGVFWLTKLCMHSSIRYDDQVSPGCCRAIKKITLFKGV